MLDELAHAFQNHVNIIVSDMQLFPTSMLKS
jgi:hypothetical protein